jgi:hypothetical protein
MSARDVTNNLMAALAVLAPEHKDAVLVALENETSVRRFDSGFVCNTDWDSVAIVSWDPEHPLEIHFERSANFFKHVLDNYPKGDVVCGRIVERGAIDMDMTVEQFLDMLRDAYVRLDLEQREEAA